MRVQLNDLGMQQLKTRLQSRLNNALVAGARISEEVVAIDTSSLQLSIDINPARIVGDRIIGSLQAGGKDFTGQILATGKEGRYVDYAAIQENKTGFLSAAIPVIISELESG